PVIVVAGHLPLGAAEQLGCPVPSDGTLVQKTPGAGQQGLLHSRGFAGRSASAECEAPNAGQENPRVQFQRPVAATPPAYHSWTVAEVEDVLRVKPAVQEVWALLW